MTSPDMTAMNSDCNDIDWRSNIDFLIRSMKSETIGFCMFHENVSAHTMRLSYEEYGVDYMSPHETEIMDRCGTAACIYGTAQILFLPDKRVGGFFTHWDRIRRLLGLSVEQSDALFMPTHDNKAHIDTGYYRRGFITRAMAVACLENYRDTGEVDWDCGSVKRMRDEYERRCGISTVQ